MISCVCMLKFVLVYFWLVSPSHYVHIQIWCIVLASGTYVSRDADVYTKQYVSGVMTKIIGLHVHVCRLYIVALSDAGDVL